MNPELFTADYSGTPGQRTFYLQVKTAEGVTSYALEKQQVGALAEKLREMLLMIDSDDTIAKATPARDPALRLIDPAQPEWRIGAIGLAYEETEDRIIVLLQPVADTDDEDDDEPDVFDEESGTRLELRRDQVRSFCLHALSVVSEGRPICQLCGLPLDPEGHNCPASNGHRPGLT